MKFRFHTSRGFTLIETLIGIAVIALVITAAAELTQGSLKLSGITQNQFAAYHLAEEGLEIIRNTRDSNWLRNKLWDEGLVQGRYIVQDRAIPIAGQPPWELVAGGEPDPAAMFKRTIDIRYELPFVENRPEGAEAPAPGEMEELMHVVSTVNYRERGQDKNITLETILTDWKKGPL